MAVSYYRGKPFLHDQEIEAFQRLCSAGTTFLGDGGDVRIIGNVVCNNCEIDALVLGHRSITIVDFKHYGGTIQVSENAEWLTSEGVSVKGGAKDLNPYCQVRRYKRGLMPWLGGNGLLPEQNDLGHISGLVLFTQSVLINDETMSPVSKKWFRAADFVNGINFLRNRASPHLELSSDCMDRIIEHLPVQPFALKPIEMLVPSSMIQKARRDAEFEIYRQLEDDENAKWWAENGERLQKDYDEACRGWAIYDAVHKKATRKEIAARCTAKPSED